jgi:hypothetical protein
MLEGSDPRRPDAAVQDFSPPNAWTPGDVANDTIFFPPLKGCMMPAMETIFCEICEEAPAVPSSDDDLDLCRLCREQLDAAAEDAASDWPWYGEVPS